MDVSSASWYSTLDMEEQPFIHHFGMNSPDDQNYQSFSSKGYSLHQAFEPKASPIMCFENSIPSPLVISLEQSYENNMNYSYEPGENIYSSQNSGVRTDQRFGTKTRTPLHAKDHMFAERKRREKLNERFIALSALVPGLKKMDKATILGDTVKYLKQLQDRVKNLEEQTAKEIMESVIFVKKSRLSFKSEYDNSSLAENLKCNPNQPLPEIEARVSDQNVLIRIHCKKHKGYVAKITTEIEKLCLIVTNSSVLPFGNYAMDVTVVAQMDTDYGMTVKDLVTNLKQALLKFM